MNKKLSIIKVGGNIIEDNDSLEKFLTYFSQIEGHKILVHGGGVLASQMSESLGIPVIMKEGRRVTCKETIDIVTMVYAGKINKSIAAKLSSHGKPAIGLCGADNRLIISEKRPTDPIDYGYVGDVKFVNGEFLRDLLNDGLLPVIAPLSCDDSGQILNTNGDTIAAQIASSMSQVGFSVSLTYVMNLPGVLMNAEDPNSLIPTITPELAADLHRQGTISDGMIPKLSNCFTAKGNGAQSVMISGWRSLGSLNPIGTEILL